MTDRLRRALPDIAILALLLLLPLIFFFPQTLGGQTMLPADNLYQWQPYHSQAAEAGVDLPPHNPLLSDLVLENLAWKQFARQQIAGGDIPLWQPNILAGSPFLAAGQSSMLYPFSLIFLVLPIPAAFGWFTVLTLWLAGINMYIFGRVLGLHRPASTLSAVAYQLCGFLLVSGVFPMIIATAAWLPLILAMIELTIRQEKALSNRPASLPWVFVGAGALGMAALAGHVEALYFTLLVSAFYALWRLIAELIQRRADASKRRWLAGRVVWLAVLVVAGLALGAVQLIPAYELAGRSFRQGATPFAEVLTYAYPLRRVVALLIPNFFGSPAHHAVRDLFGAGWQPITANALGNPIRTTEWGLKNYVEGMAYLGLLPMLLAGIAVWQWGKTRLSSLRHPHPARPAVVLPLSPGRGAARPLEERAERGEGNLPEGVYLAHESPARPYRALFLTLALLSLSFVFGTNTYALLYYGLPFINQSHAPFRWVWPLALSVAVLAGFGVEALAVSQEGSPLYKGEMGRPKVGQRGPAPNLLGWIVLSAAAFGTVGLVIARLAYPQIAAPVERLFNGLALANTAFPDARTFFSYEWGNAAIFALMLALSGIGLILTRSQRRIAGVRLWHVLAVIVTAADLMIPLWGFYPANDPALLDVVPPSIQWLKDRQAEEDPFRIAVYEVPGTDTLNANTAWLHGLEDISGYDSLIPGQYADYMGIIQPQTDLLYNRIAPLTTDHPDALDSPLLDLLGVRYVVSEIPIDNPRFDLAYEDDAVRIYRSESALPRAFTLPHTSLVVSAADDPDEGFRLQSSQRDFRQYVVVNHQDMPTGVLFPEFLPSDPVSAPVTRYTAQELFVDAAVDEHSWLVVTNSYYPGWRAWVRPADSGEDAEQEVPVIRANGNFMTVELEPGDWTIRLKFSPDSFRFGAFASFLTFMALIFALGVYVYRLVYTEQGEGAGIQRVAKNTLTPIVLNLFNKGIQFVLTFAMLRILGPERAGDYRYAVVIWGWFEILSNFGLNTFLMREVSRHKDDANRYLVNTTVLRLMLAGIGIPALIGFLYIRQTFVSPPQNPATLITIGILYAGLFFSTISTGLTALFYAYERAEVPAAVQTVSAFLTTALGITALLLGWGIVGLAGVSVTVNLVTFAILGTLALRSFFKPKWTFNWKLQREALGESFPLMLNHLLATLFFRIDVVLLEAISGAIVVGWYSTVYTWIDAIMVIPSFFTLSLFPVMSRQALEDRPALKRAYLLAVKLMTLISVPTAIFSTLLAPFLINVLGGPQYLPHGAIALQIFIWSILIGWINSVTQYVIIALNRQRTLTVTFVVAAAFNIIANLIFIPRYSYPAAAFITILSEVVLWGMFYVVLMSELGRVNWLATLWRIALAGVVTGAVTFLLGGIDQWLGFGAGLIVYVAAFFVLRPLNRDELTRLAPALPGGVRKRLLPGIAVQD